VCLKTKQAKYNKADKISKADTNGHFMGVPASSANIERAFSTAVDIKSAKRNKIKAALFQMLLFIKKNFYLLSLKLK
jgi:hypothetical protein